MSNNQKLLFQLMMDFYRTTTDGEGRSKIYGRMGHLVRKVHKAIDKQATIKTQVQQLLYLVYEEWGFYCDDERYFLSDNLYLDQVLESKSGMPVSLGAIILYLAESLQLPIYPMNFPTQLVLRVDLEEEILFIDPWDGKFISRSLLATWFEGYLGFGHKMLTKDLACAKSEELRDRFNQVAKMALIREERYSEALGFITHLLRHNPEDPYEIRDRGLVLAHMECLHAAIPDLSYFIEHCPDDPTAVLLMAQMSELKEQQYPLH
ncbi:SirB1 family protein [Conservatibacter flavescens]|uniref:Protein SirB1 N-terminal domain-containing protein n=1 Tax=Conservatibacter flavescens TaxID=28161 RepID=A0A2M8S5U9_9PAST|nr:SirB1 family protein [Conservatibacter flavescens]PJG86516.1 hypothetical protein CVP05_01545 [Conservatibacter flavescens]